VTETCVKFARLWAFLPMVKLVIVLSAKVFRYPSFHVERVSRSCQNCDGNNDRALGGR